MKEFLRENWALLLAPTVLAAIFAFLLIQPYFEMQTYNKFKSPDKPEATYWDAMFAELRIQDK